MCEANAYIYKEGKETLVFESVDLLEPIEPRGYRLRSIFGDQKTIKGKLKLMSLVEHKIVFEE